MLKIFFWLVVLAGLAYVAIRVPFGEHTLLDRVLGSDHPQPQVSPEKTNGGPAKTPGPSDRLTDQDRKNLDHLIESKVKDKPKH